MALVHIVGEADRVQAIVVNQYHAIVTKGKLVKLDNIKRPTITNEVKNLTMISPEDVLDYRDFLTEVSRMMDVQIMYCEDEGGEQKQ